MSRKKMDGFDVESIAKINQRTKVLKEQYLNLTLERPEWEVGENFEYLHHLDIDKEKRQAEDGDGISLYKMSVYYRGIKRLPTQGMSFLKKAAAKGIAQACYELANYDLQEDNNYKEVFECLMKAAQDGHTLAPCWLAKCYYFGIGTPKNLEEAAAWIEYASCIHNGDTLTVVGICYKKGVCVPISKEKALQFFKEAYEKYQNSLAYSFLYPEKMQYYNPAQYGMAMMYQKMFIQKPKNIKELNCYQFSKPIDCFTDEFCKINLRNINGRRLCLFGGNEFPKVVNYGDGEGLNSVELLSLALGIHGPMTSINIGDFETAKSQVNDSILQAESFLRRNFNCLFSFGVMVNYLYNYAGCIEWHDGNLMEAKRCFVKAMVFRCLSTVYALSIDTFEHIEESERNNNTAIYNYNTLCQKRVIDNPYDEVSYLNLSAVVLYAIIYSNGKGVFSYAALVAYQWCAKNLLEIAKTKGELDVSFQNDFVEIFKVLMIKHNLMNRKAEMEHKVSGEVWSDVMPIIKRVFDALNAEHSVNNIISSLYEKHNLGDPL